MKRPQRPTGATSPNNTDGNSIPSKEELVGEIRTLLRAIEVHPFYHTLPSDAIGMLNAVKKAMKKPKEIMAYPSADIGLLAFVIGLGGVHAYLDDQGVEA
jgi:hypothetical protein